MRWKLQGMPMLLIVSALMLGLVALAGCGSPATKETASAETTETASGLDAFDGLSGTINIAGGTAHIPVMEAVSADVMSANDAIVITVAGGGSGVGVQQVGEGLVNIGNSGREPKDEELAKYTDLKLFPWAIDGVTAIVHPDNPIRDLTADQVKDIFAGKITDWSAVGKSAGAINVYAREDGSGTGETFIEKGLDKGEVSSKATIVTSNGAMKTAVAADKQAIGFMSIGGVDPSVAAVAYNGVAPTNENALAGTYVVTRKLYSITKGEPAGPTKVFLDFLTGPDGVSYIEKAGFIPTYAK
jgi:phosphate transport system substrate-binding protein